MRIHLIRKETIDAFAERNVQSRTAFNDWNTKLRFADWTTPADMATTYPGTDLLGNGTNRAVFDIGGNKYRMIAKYAFGEKRVHLFICWLGTHAAYTKLCNKQEQYTVNDY